MNPAASPYPAAHKDAIVLSPHKFIGGPGTPGVLGIRRDLLTNSVPVVVGGGTVAYVNPAEHVYLSDPVHREEGGTPAIVESIRAGLAFQLKEQVGSETITADKILICTGGRPEVPPVPGHEFAITSNEAFHLPTLPRRVCSSMTSSVAVRR